MIQETSQAERRTIQIGGIEIRYYVREPSPDNWNAVGVIYSGGTIESNEGRCPLVVGVGSTYYEAIGDLIARAMDGSHPDLPRHVIEREAERSFTRATAAYAASTPNLAACASSLERSAAV